METGKGVNVFVRVRPPLPREYTIDHAVTVPSDNLVRAYKGDQQYESSFDKVFGEQATQYDVYERVKGCVASTLAGYNNTVFAYGQTGTGKTHTMLGAMGASGGSNDATSGADAVLLQPTPSSAHGVVPRAAHDLFLQLDRCRGQHGGRVQVSAMYMEIYKERIFDLLQPYKRSQGRDPLNLGQYGSKTGLLIKDGPNGTYVPNLLCVKVKDEHSICELLAMGDRNRSVRHTEMNVNSSRSHAILQLVVEQWPQQGEAKGEVLRSKLNFVDLAGSERWNRKDEMSEEKVSEMTYINSSLLTLAQVVAALTENGRHIPYRDSKLTYLLQDSLGGNCCTTVIATVSPSVDAFEETCSTLRFADRARNIPNKAVVNRSKDVTSVLAQKDLEIQRLRQLLQSLAEDGSGVSTSSVLQELTAGLHQERLSTAERQAAVQRLQDELQSTRQALEAERQMRSDLEARLMNINTTDSGTATPTTGGTSGSPSRLGAYQHTESFGTSSAEAAAGGAGSSSGGAGTNQLSVLLPGGRLSGPAGSVEGGSPKHTRLPNGMDPSSASPTGRAASEGSWSIGAREAGPKNWNKSTAMVRSSQSWQPPTSSIFASLERHTRHTGAAGRMAASCDASCDPSTRRSASMRVHETGAAATSYSGGTGGVGGWKHNGPAAAVPGGSGGSSSKSKPSRTQSGPIKGVQNGCNGYHGQQGYYGPISAWAQPPPKAKGGGGNGSGRGAATAELERPAWDPWSISLGAYAAAGKQAARGGGGNGSSTSPRQSSPPGRPQQKPRSKSVPRERATASGPARCYGLSTITGGRHRAVPARRRPASSSALEGRGSPPPPGAQPRSKHNALEASNHVTTVNHKYGATAFTPGVQLHSPRSHPEALGNTAVAVNLPGTPGLTRAGWGRSFVLSQSAG